MGNLFQILLSAIKAKIVPVWTKIKLWTNISFIRTRIFTVIRHFFTKMLDIRPRDKKDYYHIFGWMVSRRLAVALMLVVGVLSLYYLFVVNPPSVFSSSGDGIKTYSYNSIPLRFTKGNVRILAKSKYVAYEGEVAKGAANGRGTLYRRDGSTVYEGMFENNKYNGDGRLYFETGQIQYTGSFKDNLPDGQGKEFRENGTLLYEGAFADGVREGAGNLYNEAGRQAFAGNFTGGNLIYSDFLGKSTAEAGEMYMGGRTVYTDGSWFAVDMADIGAVYFGQQESGTLDESIQIEGVYILEDNFPFGGEQYSSISGLEGLFGRAEYEGNAYLNMPEAACIHILNQSGNAFYGDVEGTWDAVYADAVNVAEFDQEYSVYLYTFEKDGLRYTFYCKDRTGEFSMYLIER